MLLLFALLSVTFNRDVAPILRDHCVECHRQGEVAPFPLTEYKDAATRAKLIAKVTETGFMPPWKPVRGYGRFSGDRSLSPAEITTLRNWAAAGSPLGRPPTPAMTAATASGWKLGPPDLVLEMPAPFTLQEAGADVYRCFVVPGSTTEDRWIRAVDFQPSNRKVVHHALFFTTTTQKLPADYSCFGTPGFVPASTLGGWSPGNNVLSMPEGTAMRLPKGASIVMQIHLHPSGKTEVEQSKLGLYFAAQPPVRHIVDVALTSRAIDIAPGERSYKVRDHFVIPVNVHAVGIIPHAHYIARDVKGWAILPNGQRRWLLWIKDWDFDWQDRYWYTQPIALAAGTRVQMEITYDNSTGNPRNPSSPPKRVAWGGGSEDEMAGLHIQVIPDREEDLRELGQALWGKVMRMVGGRFYTPKDP